ncbi:MAG: zf-HC2 domain-containing protein [Candidatus Omnitrophica bacterium]|nr:zf-HC2 domain-containing protein [Candidatus Omnitrophota bacterium]
MLKNLFKRQCPDDETVACYMDGLLPAKEKSSVDKHLKSCSACREAFAIHKEVAEQLKVADLEPVPKHLVEAAKNLWSEKYGVRFLDIVVTVAQDFLERARTTGEIIKGSLKSPEFAYALRDGGEQKTTTLRVRKIFEDIRIDIEVSRTAGDNSMVSLKLKDDKTDIPLIDLRATLILDDTELESYVTQNGKVVFENIRPGVYMIQISRVDRAVGVISLELTKK